MKRLIPLFLMLSCPTIMLAMQEDAHYQEITTSLDKQLLKRIKTNDLSKAATLIEGGGCNLKSDRLARFAAEKATPEMFSLLLQNGLPVHGTDKMGNTLFFSTFDNPYHYAICRQLVAAGLAIDQPNNNHQTPLSYAIGYAKSDNVRALLAHGADPYATCGSTTPFERAARVAGSADARQISFNLILAHSLQSLTKNQDHLHTELLSLQKDMRKLTNDVAQLKQILQQPLSMNNGKTQLE